MAKPVETPPKRGRPSLYRVAYAKQALNLALLGATDADLARAFDVSEQTINAWKATVPAFLESLKKGKDHADGRVARSLYQRALGYSHKAVKIVADANTGMNQVVPFTEHYPPDTTACIFWLKNRRSADWRDKQDLEHTGKDGGALEVQVTYAVVDPSAH